MARPTNFQKSDYLARQRQAVSFDVQGAGEVYRLFDSLGTGRKNRAIRAAMGPAGLLLKKAAKKNAPISRKGSTAFGRKFVKGSLRKNIHHVVKSVPSKKASKAGDPITAFVAIVGIKSKTGETSVHAMKLGATEKGTRRRATRQGWSRGQVIGSGWFADTLISHKGQAAAVFTRKFRERMLAEVKKKYKI